MSLTSRLVARLAKLPPATHRVEVKRDLVVPADDGAALLTDRYLPTDDRAAPLVLMRTPYGRRRFEVFGRLFAERGYQVLVQSVRGTFGSGGTFDAFRDEERDGRATLAFLGAQPWCPDAVGMFGPSYLGVAQWAVAHQAPSFLKALCILVASSNRREVLYPGGSFALDFALSWTRTLERQEGPAWRLLVDRAREQAALRPAFAHLPLEEADEVAIGRRVGFYQDWLAHPEPGDPFWEPLDFTRTAADVTVPVCLVGGWYDYFLPRQLLDYELLRAAGHNPRLVVGPWKHTDPGVLGAGLREALAFFDLHLQGREPAASSPPVKIHLVGGDRDVELERWPPPATVERWHLHEGGHLREEPPSSSSTTAWTYDPQDPTPSVGGAVIGGHGGPRDNRSLEARRDVTTWTSVPLTKALTLAGTPSVSLHVACDAPSFDVFARLCDVAPDGRSTNLCDALVRCARATDAPVVVDLALSPIACVLAPGHRLRLQVSAGAHPRFARNPGLGEPLGSARQLRVARLELFHDPDHPSACLLPVVSDL